MPSVSFRTISTAGGVTHSVDKHDQKLRRPGMGEAKEFFLPWSVELEQNVLGTHRVSHLWRSEDTSGITGCETSEVAG